MFVVIIANLANYARQVRMNKLWDATGLRRLWAFMAFLYIISAAAIVIVTKSNVLLAIFICLPLCVGAFEIGAISAQRLSRVFCHCSWHILDSLTMVSDSVRAMELQLVCGVQLTGCAASVNPTGETGSGLEL